MIGWIKYLCIKTTFKLHRVKNGRIIIIIIIIIIEPKVQNEMRYWQLRGFVSK